MDTFSAKCRLFARAYRVAGRIIHRLMDTFSAGSIHLDPNGMPIVASFIG